MAVFDTRAEAGPLLPPSGTTQPLPRAPRHGEPEPRGAGRCEWCRLMGQLAAEA
jgi:hypothetical protein